ncbi:MAG: hypothetical protein AB7T49_17680 [Oligoflexales bacterium]
MRVKFLLGIVSLFLSELGSASEANLETTAVRLMQQDDFYLDFTAPDFEARKQVILQDLTMIFDHALTERGKKVFVSPQRFEEGWVKIVATEEYDTILSNLFPEGAKEIDIGEETSLGNEAIDQLIDKYAGYKLKKLPHARFYGLSFSARQNPAVVAREFESKASVLQDAFESSNWFNGDVDIVRLGTHGLYGFQICFGNGTSGCDYANQTTFSVQRAQGTVLNGGSRGSAVDPERYAWYFLPSRN